jgi:uncharacterized protein
VSESICVSCGLCCDGTIFTNLTLREGDDPDVMTRAGVALIQRGGRGVVTLPCAALVDRRCTVYRGRPQTCREFRCKLLREHEAGDVGTAEALATIASTIELRDRVREVLDEYLGPADGPSGVEDRMLTAAEKIAAAPDPEAEEAAQPLTVMYSGFLRSRVRNSFGI